MESAEVERNSDVGQRGMSEDRIQDSRGKDRWKASSQRPRGINCLHRAEYKGNQQDKDRVEAEKKE